MVDAAPQTRRRWWLGAVVVLLAVAAALAARLLGREQGDSGLLQVNGRIEGDLVIVAPMLAGRIAELLVREGDQVRAGQVLARLDQAAVAARLDEAQAARHALQAQADAQAGALSLLRAETPIQLAAARAGVQAAQADLRRAEAASAQQARDLDRVRDLARQGFVGPQAVEQSELAHRSAREQEAVAGAALARALQAARDAELAPQRIRASAAQTAATRAQVQAAAARVEQARSQVDDLSVHAPAPGRIAARYVNQGEVVAAGAPLFGLTDLSRVYLKAYVPEPMLGRIRLGLPAQIWVDAFADRPFDAKLGFIASQAEFTPKEVQTRDERTKLVYEVRLYPSADPGGKLLPGQPGDAMIRHVDTAAWRKPGH
ncbi:MAG: efflux RND transporter periplasmic adaptor subunit [Rhizobacter sp.]|nr:efflux RND transporter periplasmic adaptor subunit [Rhizobacter sp.]